MIQHPAARRRLTVVVVVHGDVEVRHVAPHAVRHAAQVRAAGRLGGEPQACRHVLRINPGDQQEDQDGQVTGVPGQGWSLNTASAQQPRTA